MKLSRKLKIIKKLRSSGYVDKGELNHPDIYVIKEVKIDMRNQRDINREKLHDKGITKMLSKNKISRKKE